MRYVIVGTGAVGGAIACLLAEAGRAVVAVARGAHGEAIAAHGLTLRRPSGTRTWRIPRVASASELALARDDVVLFAVKSQDATEALAAIAPNAAIVCAQNGVVTEPMVAARGDRVHGMMSWIAAQHLEPGVVELFDSSRPGVFRVGRYPDGIDELDERVAADLSAAGFDAAAVPDVMRWKHAKLLTNLGNVLDACCERCDALRSYWERAAAEGEAVLRAACIDFMPLDELFASMLARTGPPADIEGVARGGGSTWQSLVRCRSIEVDQLNGWIVELGARVGAATPVNRALVGLAAEVARPRSASIERLRLLIEQRAAPERSERDRSVGRTAE